MKGSGLEVGEQRLGWLLHLLRKSLNAKLQPANVRPLP
jgi:hypothetical protein